MSTFLLVVLQCMGFLSAHAGQVKGKILVVASSADQLKLKGGKKFATGTYLNEMVVPSQRFIDAGYEVVFATPTGAKPIIDGRSKSAEHFLDVKDYEKAVQFVATHPSLQKPLKLRDAVQSLETYSALFIPGGHAPMIDLMQDPDLGKALRHFHDQSKPTAFLCHGPIASLAALPKAVEFRKALVNGDTAAQKKSSRSWQYAGYRMTIFSNREEAVAEKNMLKGSVPFLVADALQNAGGKVQNGPEFKSFVVQDRELITGQNPASDVGLTEAVLKTLEFNRGVTQ